MKKNQNVLTIIVIILLVVVIGLLISNKSGNGNGNYGQDIQAAAGGKGKGGGGNGGGSTGGPTTTNNISAQYPTRISWPAGGSVVRYVPSEEGGKGLSLTVWSSIGGSYWKSAIDNGIDNGAQGSFTTAQCSNGQCPYTIALTHPASGLHTVQAKVYAGQGIGTTPFIDGYSISPAVTFTVVRETCTTFPEACQGSSGKQS